MKQGHQLLSEQEAVLASGVSLGTLLRFAEAGYLQLQGSNTEGSRMFSSEQLKGLFGSSAATQTSLPPVESASDKGISGSTEQIIEIELGDRRAELSALPPIAADTATEIEVATESAAEPLGIGSDSVLVAENNPDTPAGNDQLKTILNLQEQLLAAKEKALSDLETQCRWLQERIERLELKSERDQLLILSETQTLTKLLTASTEKKSAGRKFLEWIGVAQPTATMVGATIDLNEKSE
jgi:hypothetical protein